MLTAPAAWVHLDWVLVVVVAWMLIGVLGVFALRRFRFVAVVLFPVGGAFSLLLLGVGLSAALSTPETAVLPIGLPQLPFHLRLDSLSAFFLIVIGGVAAGVSAFAAGYFRKGEGTPPGLICLEYHVFLASIAMVVIADDAYAFMVVWETMAFSSFFLVMANHRIPEIRNAGYLYMLVAHIGALGILLCFGVLQANTGDYTFASMRAQHLSPFWASAAFVLALFGFGAKAGILPLHAWLPEAHPAAPSPFSALMSAVMLKIALYGMLRVAFDLLQTRIWWWGVLLMGVGLATALFGVVFVGVFASAELQDEAALVVALEETFGPAQFDIVIVLAGADAEFHFLHAGGAFRFLFFQFRLLVFVFPVIDDFADRRVHLTGDFDEVESEGLGFGESLAGTHDAELLAGGEDDTNFRGTDAVIDPRHVAVTTPVLVSCGLSDGIVLQWVDATRRSTDGRCRRTRPVRRGLRNDGPNAGSWIGDSMP